MKYLLIALIFLSACGTPPKVDSELQPFINSFIELSKQYNPELDLPDEVYFDVLFVPKLKSPYIGTCGSQGIQISKEFWDRVGHFDREQLMFHELGHCFLGLNHTKTIAIMYPYLINQFYYISHRDELLRGLFIFPIQQIYVTPGSCAEDDEIRPSH
jgi:hypothetical protein